MMTVISLNLTKENVPPTPDMNEIYHMFTSNNEFYQDLLDEDILEISRLMDGDVDCEKLREMVQPSTTFEDKRKQIFHIDETWDNSFYSKIVSKMDKEITKSSENDGKLMFTYSSEILDVILKFKLSLLTVDNIDFEDIRDYPKAKKLHSKLWDMIFKDEEIMRSMIYLGVPRNFFYDN